MDFEITSLDLITAPIWGMSRIRPAVVEPSSSATRYSIQMLDADSEGLHVHHEFDRLGFDEFHHIAEGRLEPYTGSPLIFSLNTFIRALPTAGITWVPKRAGAAANTAVITPDNSSEYRATAARSMRQVRHT